MLKKVVASKVFKNFSYLTVGTILAQIISLFTLLKITQFFSPDDYGIYTFLMVQGALILTVGDLGLRNIIIRRIARDPLQTKNLTYNGAILRIAALILFSLIYLLYNSFFGSLTAEQLLLVFLFAIVSCLSKLLEAAYLGNQKMFPPALINLVFSVIWFAVIYFLPIYYFTVPIIFGIFLFLGIIKSGVFYSCLQFQNLLQGEVSNLWRLSNEILKESWPYLVLVLVMLPFTHLSNNFLDINSTAGEIGFFNLSERLIGPIAIVMDLALVAIFPNISALWITSETKFKQFISVGFRYFILLAVFFCFLFSLLAREIFTLFLPATYLPAVIVCQLQIWYLLLTSIDSFIGTILGATNKEKLILKLGVVRSIFSTPILFVGSMYGALGLSYGYVLSFALFQIFLWYIFARATNIKIDHAWILFGLAFLLFLISQLIVPGMSTASKIIVACVFIGGSSFYIVKSFKIITT